MKTRDMRMYWLFLLILMSLPIPGQAADSGENRPYGVEKGVIEMVRKVVNPAATIETIETIYFKDWGRVIARYTTETMSSKFMKEDKVSRSFSLQDGTQITTVDLDDMTGHRINLSAVSELQGMSEAQQKQFAENLTDAMGTKIKKLDQQEVAGKMCDVNEAVTEMGPMKQTTLTYTWKNILLKQVAEGMGSEISEEAKSIVTGQDIPEEKFRVPEGADIKEAPAMP